MQDVEERRLTSTDNDGIVRLRGGSKSALLLPATDLGASGLTQTASRSLHSPVRQNSNPRVTSTQDIPWRKLSEPEAWREVGEEMW